MIRAIHLRTVSWSLTGIGFCSSVSVSPLIAFRFAYSSEFLVYICLTSAQYVGNFNRSQTARTQNLNSLRHRNSLAFRVRCVEKDTYQNIHSFDQSLKIRTLLAQSNLPRLGYQREHRKANHFSFVEEDNPYLKEHEADVSVETHDFQQVKRSILS